MYRYLLSLLFLTYMFPLSAQEYTPPLTGTQWDTLSPASLGWCEDGIDSLYTYLELKGTKSFIVLKGGKIVLEKYFGTFQPDSLWYWASAGKSLTSMLVGIAQSDGLVGLDNPTSDYLGTGWTSATAPQEAAITVRHQLSMGTGLDDNVTDLNCLTPACLQFLTTPYDRWAYYNAPYRLLLDVLANASGQPINAFTREMIGDKIGMGGFWLNYVRYGKARDMARFGLLSLRNGIWGSDTVLQDTAYARIMRESSQPLNTAYGYLWWLNGTGSYMLPRVQLVLNTNLIPNAPDDLYAALGKNDQKIYVIPSRDMVVVRQGNAAGNSLFALSSFDNELWGKLNTLECATTSIKPGSADPLTLYPNPTRHFLNMESPFPMKEITVLDLTGKRILSVSVPHKREYRLSLTSLAPGSYFLVMEGQDGRSVQRFVKN